jgi:hypothetical protein
VATASEQGDVNFAVMCNRTEVCLPACLRICTWSFCRFLAQTYSVQRHNFCVSQVNYFPFSSSLNSYPSALLFHSLELSILSPSFNFYIRKLLCCYMCESVCQPVHPINVNVTDTNYRFSWNYTQQQTQSSYF